MQLKNNILYLIIFNFCCLSLLKAQGPPPGVGSGTASTSSASVDNPLLEEEIDTTKIFYFFSDRPNQLLPFRDTLLDGYFQQYDPTRKRDFDFGHLGNLGSAARPLVWQPIERDGFDVGFHQFDVYKKNVTDLPFYNLDKAFSEAYYSQGNSKSLSNFAAKLARNFANNINISMDFFRINQAGQYQNQRTFNTAMNIGLWYHTANNRYTSFIIFSNNVTQQIDNGGVAVDSLVGGGLFATPISIPVQIKNSLAVTRHAKKEISLRHSYQLRSQTDSTSATQRNYTLSHFLSYSEGSYKFSNTLPDSNFYQNFRVDDRGLRHFIGIKSIENSFAVSTYKLTQKDSQNSSINDILEIGIRHRYFRILQEPNTETRQNFSLFAKWNFAPNPFFKFDAEANYQLLGANATDYSGRGNLQLTYPKMGFLLLQLMHQRYAPSLIQNTIFVTAQKVWNNDFDRTIQTNLMATFDIPRLRFSISGQYHLLNNFIYYDTIAYARQSGAPISIAQLLLKQDFKLGVLHLDNIIAFQTNTQKQVLRLPEIWSKHSLYIERRLFKRAMLLRFGVDVRLNSTYFADAYQPLVGQFYLQNKRAIMFYPATDVFVSAKIQNWRFFFKWEGCSQYFLKGTYYQTYRQPQFEETFRFGVKLQLRE